MPGYDKTGPEGTGRMTGRRMGRCTNYGRNLKKKEPTSPTEQNDNSPENLPGRGLGMRRTGSGRGRARGMGRQNRSGGNA
jgi:hypothetical protein